MTESSQTQLEIIKPKREVKKFMKEKANNMPESWF